MTTEAPAAPPLRDRDSIPDRFKWNLTNIFADWDEWQSRVRRARPEDRRLRRAPGHARRRRRAAARRRCSCATRSASSNTRCGTSRRSGTTRTSATTRSTRGGSRCRSCSPRRRRRRAWFDPELLEDSAERRSRQWMAASPELAVYRFAIEDLYRQQEHVLDDKGEHLLSLSSRFSSSPNDAYAALSTADVKHPTVRLSTGAEATLTYGQYRAILATNRNQADRAAAFHAFHKIYDNDRQHLRVALQRRAAARPASIRRRAATRRRSKRRCTATTSRPRSSRT